MDDLTLLTAGETLELAQAAMILAHGRGATAEDILSLAAEASVPGFAFLAPQAPGHTWYPNHYNAPIESNQPWLDRALATIDTVVIEAETQLPSDRVVLVGFSQGACLTLEYAARHARRWGGVVGLSGALIGPPGTPRDYPGDFAGTPAFLGCSDSDPHVLAEDVTASAAVLERLGATVGSRLYPAMGHSVNDDELGQLRRIMEAVVAD